MKINRDYRKVMEGGIWMSKTLYRKTQNVELWAGILSFIFAGLIGFVISRVAY